MRTSQSRFSRWPLAIYRGRQVLSLAPLKGQSEGRQTFAPQCLHSVGVYEADGPLWWLFRLGADLRH